MIPLLFSSVLITTPMVTYDGASPVASQFNVVPNGTDSLSVNSDLSSPTSFLLPRPAASPRYAASTTTSPARSRCERLLSLAPAATRQSYDLIVTSVLMT